MSDRYLSDTSSNDKDEFTNMVFNDEEEENNSPLPKDILQLLLIYTTTTDGERAQSYFRERLTWDKHVDNLIREGSFKKMYRMSINAFRYLCVLLDPFLYVDEIMSSLRTNQPKIGTEIIVSSFIRWTSAGSFHDIRIIAGINTSSFY
jgi:hypothetical protein